MDTACAPGYLDVIERPMDMSTLTQRLTAGEYARDGQVTEETGGEVGGEVIVDNDNNINNENSVNSNKSNNDSSNSSHPSTMKSLLSLAGFTAFVSDLRLIWRNCGVYNAPDSSIVQQVRLKTHPFNTPSVTSYQYFL